MTPNAYIQHWPLYRRPAPAGSLCLHIQKLLQTECGQNRTLRTLHDFPCKPTLQHCGFSSLYSLQKDSYHHLVAFTKITEVPLNALYFLPPVTKAISSSCLFHLQTSSPADLLPRALPNTPLQTTNISCLHCWTGLLTLLAFIHTYTWTFKIEVKFTCGRNEQISLYNLKVSHKCLNSS